MFKIRLAPWQLCVAAAAFITLVNNLTLLGSISESLDLLTLRGFGFLALIAAVVFFVLNAVFLVFGHSRLLKPVIAVFLVATATFGYFSSSMGVVFDEDMLLNMLDTVVEGNSAEATELVSLPLLVHVFLFALLPIAALYLVELRPQRLPVELASRLLVIATSAVLLAILIVPNYKFITFFAVEHRDLRFQVMPVYPMMSIVRLTRDSLKKEKPFTVIDADAVRLAASPRRTVGIMVVGETARADHFSLAGYGRQTNPELSAESDLLFYTASSCGTSTRFSVPCMFSLRGRDGYTPDAARHESNVLDILTAAGVNTAWIDNNSSCKNVCDRIENSNLRTSVDTASRYYSDGGYMDEILLDEVNAYLDSEGKDLLIVLHTLGSHGPAYSHRYPERFGRFAPYCDKMSPTECTPGAVANAYDNTIVYTDFVLGALIDKLKARADTIDSFLFYASDHGESLGEAGLYLHGLPYAVAPDAQKMVPMAIWLSPGFRDSNRLGLELAKASKPESPSHDYISHTLLGLFNVQASSYSVDLDLLANAHTSRYAGASRPVSVGAN